MINKNIQIHKNVIIHNFIFYKLVVGTLQKIC